MEEPKHGTFSPKYPWVNGAWLLVGSLSPSLRHFFRSSCRCSVGGTRVIWSRSSPDPVPIQPLSSLRLSLLTTRPRLPQFPAPRQDGRKQRPPENNVLALKLPVGEYGAIPGTFKTTRGHVEVSGATVRLRRWLELRLYRDCDGIVRLGTNGRCSGTQHHCFCCMGRNEGLCSGQLAAN